MARPSRPRGEGLHQLLCLGQSRLILLRRSRAGAVVQSDGAGDEVLVNAKTRGDRNTEASA